jgi:hypothetical protein
MSRDRVISLASVRFGELELGGLFVVEGADEAARGFG